MSNALGTLFGEIAGAIREKTGDTATMKPAEFPEKIAAIEAGGGSGSSIQSGAYLIEEDTIALPNNYLQFHFMLNGYRYAFTATSTSLTKTTYNFYKYENGKWTQKVSSLNLNYSAMAEKPGIVFNGKLHIFSGSYHIAYNGETSTTTYTKPSQGVNGTVGEFFVQDNTLKQFCYVDGKVYAWAESTDKWTAESSITKETYTYKYYFINSGNDVYVTDYTTKKIYQYKNKALTELHTVDTFKDSGMKPYVIHNEHLYIIRTGYSILEMSKINLKTGEHTVVGKVPKANYGFNSPGVYVFDEHIRFIGSSADSYMSMNAILVEVP